MDNIRLNRREFMQGTAIGSLGMMGLVGSALGGSTESKIENRKSKLQSLPPVRAITHEPKFHWFSYYDKLQFDPTGRYALGMEVDFEHRSPKADDIIKIGMVDLKNGDRWTELGQSSAWCWQQGCMLQWQPGSKDKIIFNDAYPDKERKQNVYLYNVATGKTVPLGHFYLPPEYKGECRCDTHPRFSPDGQSIVINSLHAGNGRQMYLIDISAIVG